MPTVSQEGTYTVVVTNGDNGCTSTAMVEVIQDANIPLANAARSGYLNLYDHPTDPGWRGIKHRSQHNLFLEHC
ncbi:MAG: hypothetical protein R2792_02920 [Saprospiraceae bacterium]